jgi:probable HAF family extracellular repeat protein
MPVYVFNTFNDPSGFTGTTDAVGVNDTDQIVGFFQGPVNGVIGAHGFLESDGTYFTLDDPSATLGTQAFGINNSGQIVGAYVNASGTHGFLYDPTSNMFPPYFTLNDPLATGPEGTTASGINASGQIVGYYQDGGLRHHGFLLSGGAYTTLDDPSAAGGDTFAEGINSSGQIVGSYSNATGTHGFVYNPSNGSYTTVDDPLAASGTLPFGINDLGQIVGFFINASGTHAFLYSGGAFTTTDDPVNAQTLAHGINNHSQIVGTLSHNGTKQGFLETTFPNPPPPGGTSADMILRGANASLTVPGQYEIYDIGNNTRESYFCRFSGTRRCSRQTPQQRGLLRSSSSATVRHSDPSRG